MEIKGKVLFFLINHVIWCPKYRKPVLKDDIEKMLKEILPFKAETLGAEIVEMETDLDHVHLLISRLT